MPSPMLIYDLSLEYYLDLLLFFQDNFSTKSAIFVQFDREVVMCSVGNLTLLCKNLYVLEQNTFNIDLNYTLNPFLAIFETFNKIKCQTAPSKRNTVPRRGGTS